MATAPAPVTLHPDRARWDAEVQAYTEWLEGRRLSPRTVRSYQDGLRNLARWLTDTERSLDPLALSHRDAQAYLAWLTRTYRPATAKAWYVVASTFYRWEVAEATAIGEVFRSPFANLRAPQLPKTRTPVVRDDEVDRLLAACAGTTFRDLRDRAILSLMVATGLRRQEVIDLLVEDVAGGVVLVAAGKGERERTTPYGAVAGEALRRYLKKRALHRDANLVVTVGSRQDNQRTGYALWLVDTRSGIHGRLGTGGLAKIFRRRAAMAGLGHLHPHQLRHTFAHSQLAANVQEGSVMRLGGWRSRAMLDRYGADLAQERALLAYRDPLARPDPKR